MSKVVLAVILTIAAVVVVVLFLARDMILRQTTRDGHEIDVPGIVPKLSLTPGTVRSPAPRLGEDTDAVLREAGLTTEQITLLRAKGAIA